MKSCLPHAAAALAAALLMLILARDRGTALPAQAQGKGGVEKRHFNPPGLHDPSKFYTHVVSVRGGKTIYVSGQVAYNSKRELVGKSDLAAQTRQAFLNLKTALAAAGAAPEDVVKITILFKNYDEKQIGVLEDGLTTCFGKHRGFTSTVIGVQALARDDLLVEVDAIAVVE